jgi:predicted HTH domain antitoxin
MEVFGVKRVAKYSFRSFITKILSVERAAKIHKVPLDEFLDTLNTAIAR